VSNYRAIATVTETMRSVLEAPVSKVVNSAHAFALRPEEASKNSPCVNVYLYHVAPNAALRNADTPTRDSGGALLRRPRAALDLHYLLSVYGDDADFQPQLILGAVIRTLHVQPLLTRKAIADAILAAKGGLLNDSDLADGETVRLTPLDLTLDELSKLWSVFFQLKYAPSIAYRASVVLIDAEVEATPPLPVRTRNVVVVPNLGPVIDRIASRPAGSTEEPQAGPIRAGHELHLIGSGFGAPDQTRVNLNGTQFDVVSATDTLVTVLLNDPPITNLAPGVTSVQVVREIDFGPPSGKHDAFASNVAAFVLVPTIIAPPLIVLSKVQVKLDVPLAAGRELVLLLNRKSAGAPIALRFATKSVAGADQEIPISGVPAGTYLVRVLVDGAESPLDVDAGGHVTGPELIV